MTGWGGSGGNEGGAAAVCVVTPGALDALPPCHGDVPTHESYQWTKKWSYPVLGDTGDTIWNIPLVANLTDDNGDGVINLCDVPDIVIVRLDYQSVDPKYELHLVSGADGQGAMLNYPDLTASLPAIADLDADGTPEIVAMNRFGHVVALSPQGDVLWESDVEVFDPVGVYGPDPTEEQVRNAKFVHNSPIAIHDLDSDGSPEILAGMTVLDATGELLFQDPTNGAELDVIFAPPVRPTALDLDGDGLLEVLFGHVTYNHDGTERWRLALTTASPHPIDIDRDGIPELLMTSIEGLTLVSAEGGVLWGPARPPQDAVPPLFDCWAPAAAVVDFGSDGVAEAVVNSCEHRMIVTPTLGGPLVQRAEPTVISTILGAPGIAGNAFDFRGTGPDWLAADHHALEIYASVDGAMQWTVGTGWGGGGWYPVVVDVDNDGSADLLIRDGASRGHADQLHVYEDAMKRPSPTRRIWNQWNYWVTNIREDAIVPQHPVMPWTRDAYRVQARLGCAERPLPD